MSTFDAKDFGGISIAKNGAEFVEVPTDTNVKIGDTFIHEYVVPATKGRGRKKVLPERHVRKTLTVTGFGKEYARGPNDDYAYYMRCYGEIVKEVEQC